MVINDIIKAPSLFCTDFSRSNDNINGLIIESIRNDIVLSLNEDRYKHDKYPIKKAFNPVITQKNKLC